MRKEGLKKDGSKNGTMDELEVDSAAVEQLTDANIINGDAVDPLDGVDPVDSGQIDVPKKKGRKGKETTDTVVEVAIPTSSVAGDNAEGAASALNNGKSAAANDADNEEDYEVEDIVGFKMEKKKKLFLVRWKNYGPESDTWEPESSLSCSELIEKYIDAHPDDVPKLKSKSGKSKKSEKAAKSPRKVNKSKAKPETAVATKKTKSKKKSEKIEDDEDYEVEDIVGYKTEKGKNFYLIRWKGYEPSSDTWENEATLSCPEIIKKYKERSAASNKKQKKGKKSAKEVTDNEEDYEVQEIVDEKTEKGKQFYLVRWKGYSANSDTWEPESSLSCPDLISKFHAQKKKRSASSEKPPSPTKKAKLSNDTVKSGKQKAAKHTVPAKEPEEDVDYEVELIVDHKTEKGKKMYLVKWKGWDSSSNTWEPETSLSCPEIVKKYLDKVPASEKFSTKPSSKKTVAKTASIKKGNTDKSAPAKKLATKVIANNKKSDKTKNKKGKKYTIDDGDVADDQEWEVEEVVDVKYFENGPREFKIRWKGCNASQDTWEPESNLTCQSLIDKFMNQVDNAPPKKKSRRS